MHDLKQQELFIKGIFIFNTLSKKEIAIINPLFERIIFDQGEPVLTQGKIGKGIYIVVYGSLNVSVRLPGRLPQTLLSFKKGDYFGEISLIENSLATATVMATKKSCCLLLKNEIFNALQTLYPKMGHKIFSRLSEVIVARTINNIKKIEIYSKDDISIPKQINVDFVRGNVSNLFLSSERIGIGLIKIFYKMFNDKDWKYLLKKMRYLKIRKNSIMAKKGDKSFFEVYFIIQGSIQVLLEHNGKIKQLMVVSPGKIIDFNILNYRKYIATYYIREDSLLFGLTSQALKEIEDSHPSLYYKYYRFSLINLSEYFKESNKKLAQISCEI